MEVSVVDILKNLLPDATGLSRYSLDIWNSPYSLDVLNFRGEEQLSETFSYTVDVTCPEPDIGAAQMLRQFASFTMGTPFQPERAVYGVIRDFQAAGKQHQQLYFSEPVGARGGRVYPAQTRARGAGF
jgi:type VI secretion system secreted protein VgrG